MYISQVSQLKPSFRALFNQAELMLNAGKKIIVEVVEKKQKRSLEQNNYYWLFNDELAKFFQEREIPFKYYVMGQEQTKPYTKDIVHEFLNKKMFGVASTKNMSAGEFCQYMNKLLLYWQEKTGGEFMMSELPANYLERKGYNIKF